MKEKISIIVPVYNGEAFIERCIQSVVKMQYENWEMIIVNDGSIDNTMDICQKYITDKRIKLINKKNEGVSVARNTGIVKSTGKYIIFLDSDDFLEENTCTVFNENMKNSDWCIAGYIQHNKNRIGKKLPLNQLISNNYTITDFSKVFANLYLGGFINSPWAKCYKRELITTFFDPELYLGEDLIFNLNYLKNCKKIKNINTTVYNYVIQSAGSLSSDLKERSFEIIYNVYRESKRILSDLFEDMHTWEDAIDQKYLIDMLVLVERGIRIGEITDYKSIIWIVNQYDIPSQLNRNKFTTYGLKWRIVYYLLKREKYKCIYMFLCVVYKLKKKGGK